MAHFYYLERSVGGRAAEGASIGKHTGAAVLSVGKKKYLIISKHLEKSHALGGKQPTAYFLFQNVWKSPWHILKSFQPGVLVVNATKESVRTTIGFNKSGLVLGRSGVARGLLTGVHCPLDTICLKVCTHQAISILMSKLSLHSTSPYHVQRNFSFVSKISVPPYA